VRAALECQVSSLNEAPAAAAKQPSGIPKALHFPARASFIERCIDFLLPISDMIKIFDPGAIEKKWQRFWEEKGFFAAAGAGRAFSIAIPPPNVTGTLHMGHAFQATLIDTLLRFHRMSKWATLGQPGTDHAGIATQMVVERQLAAEGKSRYDLGRDNFIERVWRWKEESGRTITTQLRRMGLSVDWTRERFTMDASLSPVVRDVFIKLYREGLIYRGVRLVNWDPVLRTAVSDLEVVSSEEAGFLWYIRYPVVGAPDFLTVATTRPETMLGDVAIAVHPNDERYQRFVGRKVKLSLTDREIVVIADSYVDPTFGTGCLKITPAHDFNDYEVGQRHALPVINIFNPDASLNEEAPERYRGLDRFAAREKIVADLAALELIADIQPHQQMIPRGDRSNAVIEPFLTSQWFLKAKPLAEPAIEAVREGKICLVPKNWENTFFPWMEEIRDWCISRQIWWGHRIPAWYGPNGEIYVAASAAAVREQHQLPPDYTLVEDEDVLDTWFSSALWPFATLGWPENTRELAVYYPTSVMVTAFDILFFWVARMMMMGIKLTGEVPFRTVYIHGLVRDAHGQKMSKTKGNVLDPLDFIDGAGLETLVGKMTGGLMQPAMAASIEKKIRQEFPDGIEACGTDALRFTFAVLAGTGRDIIFDPHRVEVSRAFCTKIWNAARFVLMNLGESEVIPVGEKEANPLIGRWIKSRFARAIIQIKKGIEAYRFDQIADAVYSFTWNDYCDWYLELAKIDLAEVPPGACSATRRTLVEVLEALMRLMHPVMPFISEEIWQTVAPRVGINGPSIMLQSYPDEADYPVDEEAEAEILWLQKAIGEIRRIRHEMNVPPGKAVPALAAGGSERTHSWLSCNRPFFLRLARLSSIELIQPGATEPESAVAIVDDLRLLLPLHGLVERDAEILRLSKQAEELTLQRAKSRAKLDNPDFVTRAPAAVVEKELQRVGELERNLAEIAKCKERIEKQIQGDRSPADAKLKSKELS
jgi:valyl-tRNA synthetase